MSGKIFISYRRDDSAGHAGRVHDRLAAEFGRDVLFLDVDGVPLGSAFVKVLQEEVTKCNVLLALIGPKWLQAVDGAGQRRLDDPTDFVRIEISTALECGIAVIPILLDGAPFPKADQLPPELRDLIHRNGLDVRHVSFHSDMDKLIRFLKQNFIDAPAVASMVQQDLPSARAVQSPSTIAVAALQVIKYPAPGSGKTEWFKDLNVGPEMVVVPSGSFLMGAAPSEGSDDERPQHTVDLRQPIAVSRFAITFSEWDAAVASRGVGQACDDRGWGRARRPVINVSWHDAVQYTDWLTRTTGQTYRLLSEAEWEYCCRATTTTKYFVGEQINAKQAQFSESGGGIAKQTIEVGMFPPNTWGLFDMHGNVWEWVQDTWHPNYQGSPNDSSAWAGVDLSSRVVRGGSWSDVSVNLRSATRYKIAPGYRSGVVGLRVARNL